MRGQTETATADGSPPVTASQQRHRLRSRARLIHFLPGQRALWMGTARGDLRAMLRSYRYGFSRTVRGNVQVRSLIGRMRGEAAPQGTDARAFRDTGELRTMPAG